jgi:hypothetical protein
MKYLLIGIGVVALIVVSALLAAYPTMWIVNWLFTATVLNMVFGGPLTFWKAFWLTFLCHALFKSTHTCNKDD